MVGFSLFEDRPGKAIETRSAADLAALIMSEVRAAPALAFIESVFILGPLSRPYCNWDIGIGPTGGAGDAVLRIIVGRLQRMYDLAEYEQSLAVCVVFVF